MKKLVAGALALALGFSAGFAQEAGQIGSLSTSAGKISFGAWGRSTFNIGNEYSSKKISVTDNTVDTVNQITTMAAAKDTIVGAVSAVDAATAAMLGAGIDTLNASKSQITTAAASLNAMDTNGEVTDNEWYASVAPDWSYGCRVGFWIIGRTNDERWGFDFNLDSDAAALFVGAQNYDSDSVIGSLKQKNGGLSYAESGKYAVAIGDQAKIWGIFDLNSIDLKVAFGKMREQELRGSIGDFGQRESSDVRSEDDIFTEMWPVLGMFVSAKGQEGTALEGLYAAVDCDAFGLISSADETDKEYRTSLGTLASTIQGGVGYTIPGIAQVKAQFIGDSIEESNKKYSKAKYEAARAAGFGYKDYAGRFEFGVDWLGFAGGATGIGNVDLDKNPNANLIELGVKVPFVLDEKLRQYDPEKFYNFYACLGTMGVIQKGFIFYKAHVWGGKGESNLTAYDPTGSVDLTGDAANIVMAGFDALAEVCVNPFGAQNNFLGLSFNYNITAANGENSMIKDLSLQQHRFGAEIYFKKTFAANNYFFIGVADRLTIQKMDGKVDLTAASDGVNQIVSGLGDYAAAFGLSSVKDATIDLSYTAVTNKVYIPVGVEMFF